VVRPERKEVAVFSDSAGELDVRRYGLDGRLLGTRAVALEGVRGRQISVWCTPAVSLSDGEIVAVFYLGPPKAGAGSAREGSGLYFSSVDPETGRGRLLGRPKGWNVEISGDADPVTPPLGGVMALAGTNVVALVQRRKYLDIYRISAYGRGR
jgi:hypothetical protein